MARRISLVIFLVLLLVGAASTAFVFIQAMGPGAEQRNEAVKLAPLPTLKLNSAIEVLGGDYFLARDSSGGLRLFLPGAPRRGCPLTYAPQGERVYEGGARERYSGLPHFWGHCDGGIWLMDGSYAEGSSYLPEKPLLEMPFKIINGDLLLIDHAGS